MIDNLCDNCVGRLASQAFSSRECIKCDSEVITSTTPCDRLCTDCSEKLNKCKHCGKSL